MVFIKHNSLMSDIHFNPIFIPCFLGPKFFRVQVFLGLGFSGRVQGPSPGFRSSSLKLVVVKNPAVHRCSSKQLFFIILQYSKETPVLESLFYKAEALKAYSFIKKRLQYRCFHVNIAKFLKTAFIYLYILYLMLTIYNYYYKKIKQLYIIFCMLIHVNYNKNKTNQVYLQHKWK